MQSKPNLQNTSCRYFLKNYIILGDHEIFQVRYELLDWLIKAKAEGDSGEDN